MSKTETNSAVGEEEEQMRGKRKREKEGAHWKGIEREKGRGERGRRRLEQRETLARWESVTRRWRGAV